MRKSLYVVYIPLLILEWTVDMLAKMVNIFHDSIKTLTLAVENIINEPTKPTDSAD